MDFYAKGIKRTSRFLEQYGLPAEAGRVLPAFAKAMAGSLCYPRRLELARGIEPSTRRRFGSEAFLTGSYKCVACQPKREGFARLRESYGGQPSLLAKAGAGERNRTSNLRFTKPLLCRLSYASVRTEGTPKPQCLASRHTCAHPST